MRAPEKNTRVPRVVAIGGGTGLSTMLRGLKHEEIDLTAIVTMADNGGGSGVLRQELGMLPPGDVRNCIQALANTEPTMAALLSYRFQEGSLKGQSFGNLFLAALNGMYGSFEQAVERMCEVLAVTGRVLPVTDTDVQLIADFNNGTVVRGESEIAEYKKRTDSRIRRVWLSPERPPALPGCLEAIAQADLILLGPGSLYTSVIPNLLVEGVAEAVRSADAVKIYVMNLMTQDGETERYTAADHIRALFDHGGGPLFHHSLVNSTPIPSELLPAYAREGAAPIEVRPRECAELGVTLEYAPVASWRSGLIRHDPAALTRAVMALFRSLSPTRVYR